MARGVAFSTTQNVQFYMTTVSSNTKQTLDSPFRTSNKADRKDKYKFSFTCFSFVIITAVPYLLSDI